MEGSCSMLIRKASSSDIERILEIFDCAKVQMRENGNLRQWPEGYPSREILEKDIADGNCYVLEDNGRVCGTFAFIIGDDPTYEVIENGRWLNDETYGNIHRIASDGTRKGIFEECLKFCQSLIGNIRIDTHEDNRIMQHLLEKHGFLQCGIIYVADGTPRIAYQKVCRHT